MSIKEAGKAREGFRFVDISRTVLKKRGYEFYGLDGRVLSGTIRRCQEIGMEFSPKDAEWFSEDSGLLMEQTTKGEVAVRLGASPLGLGKDRLIEHKQEMRDLLMDLHPPHAKIKRGSLSDVLEVVRQYYKANGQLPPVIKENSDAYIITSTGNGLYLAVGMFLDEGGIEITPFHEGDSEKKYMSLPFVYPRG